MNESASNILQSAKQVLILLPINPHFDEVAAGLGLYLSLTKAKKDTIIACPSAMLVEFNRLVGVNKITPEVGSKNLTMKLIDYPADQVERVSYDIERGEFKLTVIPKPQFSAPKQDQVLISYSGISADTIILIGGVHDDHFPAIITKELQNAKIMHFGMKQANFTREMLSFARQASSVSEVVSGFIKESGYTLDGDIATNLLMGMDDGSRGFSTQEVNADTFALASELMRAGGKRVPKETLPDRRNFPPGAIPGIPPMPAPGGRAPKNWYEPKVYKGSGVPTS